MAKKSKNRTSAVNGPLSPGKDSQAAVAVGTSSALASTSNTLGSSTGSIASTSGSSNIDAPTLNADNEARSVVNAPTASVEIDEELPEIQVNKWSLHDLKTACDDAVKQVCELYV